MNTEVNAKVEESLLLVITWLYNLLLMFIRSWTSCEEKWACVK